MGEKRMVKFCTVRSRREMKTANYSRILIIGKTISDYLLPDT
jgi:hypothetical protein